MVPFSHLISDSGTMTVFVNGKPYSFAKDNLHYDKVKKAIEEKNADEIVRLGNLPKTVENYAGGSVKVENGVVTYKGRAVSNTLTKRILLLMQENLPFTSMLKFLENLMQNPSKHAVDELYSFLLHRNLPITENGNFLAYKAVRPDYLDWHNGTISNKLGEVPLVLERNEVDDNWRVLCSNGYHVGSIDYVQDFHRGEGHIMIVEVNPKDVVSCPIDDNFGKCRVVFYTVVGEMEGELLEQVYKTTETSYEPATSTMSDYPRYDETNDEDDDDEDDDDEDDDYDDEDESYGPSEQQPTLNNS